MAPHLEEGQVVVYLGKGGACLTWAKVLREMRSRRRCTSPTRNTLPYGASRMGESQVRLENRTQNLILGTFPGRDVETVAEVAGAAFSRRSTATRSAGARTRSTPSSWTTTRSPTPRPWSATRRASSCGERPFFLFGKKENTPSVVRLIGRIDRERMAIGKALGLKQWTLEEEILMVKWNPHGENCVLPLYDAIHTPFLEVCEGPYKLDTRHLRRTSPTAW